MRFVLKFEGNVNTHPQHLYQHRRMKCTGATAGVRPLSPAFGNCWHEELRGESAECQPTVAQSDDVCDTDWDV